MTVACVFGQESETLDDDFNGVVECTHSGNWEWNSFSSCVKTPSPPLPLLSHDSSGFSADWMILMFSVANLPLVGMYCMATLPEAIR